MQRSVIAGLTKLGQNQNLIINYIDIFTTIYILYGFFGGFVV